MKYEATKLSDIHLYRHERSSILHPGLDRGFRMLKSVLDEQDSALVILNLNGITSDAGELSRYLLSFQEDTMLYFITNGKIDHKFKSKQLGYVLDPAHQAFVSALSEIRESEVRYAHAFNHTSLR